MNTAGEYVAKISCGLNLAVVPVYFLIEDEQMSQEPDAQE